MKKKRNLLFLLTILFYSLLHAQNPAFKVDIKEVPIKAEPSIKSTIIGYHKHFSIATFTIGFANKEEISTLLLPKNLNQIIEEAYVKIYLEKKTFAAKKFTFRIRSVSAEKKPDEIIYKTTGVIHDYLKKRHLTIDLKEQLIPMPREGVFVSLSIHDIDNNGSIGLEMTTRYSELFTYRRESGTKNWKNSFYQPNGNPWNGMVGLKVTSRY